MNNENGPTSAKRRCRGLDIDKVNNRVLEEQKNTGEREQEDHDDDNLAEGVTFQNYKPSRLSASEIGRICKDHPDVVVESASMRALQPPDIWYKPKLERAVFSEGRLSNLQVEAFMYSVIQIIRYMYLPTKAQQKNPKRS